MTPIPSAPHGRSSRWRRLAVVAPVLAALLAWPVAPAAGEPSPEPVGVPAAVSAGDTYPVTLLTGDVAVLHVAPDGRHAAWLQEPAGAGQPLIFSLDGEVYVIPAEATPYLDSGALDRRLFNLTNLVAQGYHDRARADLPLVVTAPGGAEAQTLATPAGARQQRTLPSVDAVAMSADKSRVRAVWEALRGPDPAVPGDADAQLAGADRVYLNGRVEVMLGESVPVVGAPAAWDTGLDGSGVAVAVLDTGADPHHPDLAGRIAGSANFTDDVDPPGETGVDGHGHGTHVAATVAGTGAASGGARPGVAPGADLLIGKVLADEGYGYDDWIIAGMEWAVEQGARVVNMSLGGGASDGTDLLSQAVNQLTEESGTLFVIAAGNSGPDPQTVTSPGAADRALTVGATTKDDQEAWFSSRGPRSGDLAVKPEIVAPGVDIVAARAAGTAMGDLVDDLHTSANGTSMAAPHVAGAAAIIAQRYPDLDADGIKARLVATTVRLDEPISFQGAGRLDIPAALAADLAVSHGALSFGQYRTDDDAVTRTLTYRNESDRNIVLRLTNDVTATYGTHKPSLRIRPATLVVPAGGEATAQVEFSPRASKPGDYTGYIVASDQHDPSTRAHTVMSAKVDPLSRRLTVTAMDRDGQPASGMIQAWNTVTGELTYGHMQNGEVTVDVDDGQYALAYSINDGGVFDSETYTFGAEPDLRIRRDTTLHYDARNGQPVRVETPRHTETGLFQVMWYRQVGERAVGSLALQGFTGQRLYFLRSPAAQTGVFETSITWREVQPLLTARVGGEDGMRLDPSPRLASQPSAYVGQESLPVVYVGTGTPEEFAAVDVTGKIALVTRDDQAGSDDVGVRDDDRLPLPPPDFPGPPPRVGLTAQAQAASDAGAALLMAHNDEDGLWVDRVAGAPLPIYTMDLAAGESIRQALADDAGLVLALDGVADATYNYELAFLESGSVPAGGFYDVSEHPLAVVESDYRQNSERMIRNESWIPYVGSSPFASGASQGRNGPVVRTEYVSTDNVRWQRFGQPNEFANMYWTWSPIEQYQPDQAYHRVWWGPLARPGVPAEPGLEQWGMPVSRHGDALRVLIPHYLWGSDNHTYGFIQNQLYDESQVRLRRDGEEIGTWPWPQLQVSVPAGEAVYELDLEVVNGHGNFMDTSVVTESTWRFRSARPESGYAVLPLVQLDYHLEAGAYNEVPAGTPYVLGIEPGYQPGYTGPGGFTVTVEVSYDDGVTWAEAPVGSSGEHFEAAVPAADSAAGFASVRVVATDSDGNRLTQLIERAWRIDS
jgi:subtilisin family serine protease